jgi:hypothetical protein
METVIILLIGAGISGIIGLAIGDLSGKKNGSLGFILGALLGPIGWIIVAVLAPSESTEKPAIESPADKMRRLEAENVALKARASLKAADDDDNIPTYKLD